MAPSAWQMLCGLEAWRVTQVPRQSRRYSPGQPAGGPDGDEGDQLAGQRAAALGAAYHGGSGPVGFAWVRDRAGGPVQVVAAGRALAAMPANQAAANQAATANQAAANQAAAPNQAGTANQAGAGGPRDTNQDVALKLPAGGRGQALGPGELARMLTVLPCWVRVAGVADSLLATADPQQAWPGPQAIRPSLEDGLLAAWPGAFAWLVLAEPAGRAELEELTFGVYTAQGAAQRFDNPRAQLSVRRLQDRHAELRLAASAGLWRVRVLAGAAGRSEAAEVAGLLCASADLTGLPYGLVPVPGGGRLDQLLTETKTSPGSVDADPEPASPFYGSSKVLAALARPPAREIPGSARFVLRPEFDTIPETENKTETAERGIFLGHLLDRDRLPAGPLRIPRASLNRHTFVCGATGAGKSQTVRQLLEQAAREGVPWLVIEPAKAEYSQGLAARLADGAQVIRIRPGEADQAAAGINPLEPAAWADGRRFPLQTHADLVKSLFLAAFEADEPFPQVLNAALTRAYDEHGWDLVLGEPKTPGTQPGYPALEDLQAAADTVVREAAYGAEVERNVRGFITVRLGSLRLGTPGRFFEGGHQLDFTRLLNRNVVLEIEDVGDDQDKAFLIGAVLVRLTEHLRLRQRRQPAGPQRLRHLTVLEEAHRLLRDPGPGQRGPAAKAVELFAALLAEVRAYGEGLVVAEQIPSKLLADVVKNTAVKIVHRLPAEDDRRAVGATMNLTPAQEQYIVTLPPGEAAVFADGADYPWLARMPDGTARETAPAQANTAQANTAQANTAQAKAAGPALIVTARSGTCGPDCQASPCTLRQMRQARRAAENDPRITGWAELTVLAHLAGWAMPFPGPDLIADLRALDQRRLDCALGHAVDDAVAARAAVISARVSLRPLALHAVAAMRQALADGSWLCDREEPRYLAPSYRWVLVLESLQQACRDEQDGRHPRSAEWARTYGRAIPGPDCASQLAAVAGWHAGDQRDSGQLQAVAWGRRPAPALERAAGATAGDPDWTERLGSLLDAFTQPCRWPLDYLLPPGPVPPQE